MNTLYATKKCYYNQYIIILREVIVKSRARRVLSGLGPGRVICKICRVCYSLNTKIKTISCFFEPTIKLELKIFLKSIKSTVRFRTHKRLINRIRIPNFLNLMGSSQEKNSEFQDFKRPQG
jgi:hypothetical protein